MHDIYLHDEYENVDGVWVVGGANRDLLRRELRDESEIHPDDYDLVVTGVSPEEMEEYGFRLIKCADAFNGYRDSANREVMLAREEESTGTSHQDFDVSLVPFDVSDEEAIRRDLARRDITVNSIAVHVRSGTVVDPFNGREDIKDGIIRHVPGIKEDPVRLLRVARFAPRLGFDIAPETRDILQEMADDGLDIPPQRAMMELEKTFKQTDNPRRFFDILADFGVLDDVFPSVGALQEVPAGPSEYHQEGDAYEHTMRVLNEMQSRVGNDVDALFAALAHDFGKTKTPESEHPNHHNHPRKGVAVVKEMSERFQLDNSREDAMKQAALHHMKLHRMDELKGGTVIDLVADTTKLSVRTIIALGESDAAGKEPAGYFNPVAAEAKLRRAVSVIRDFNGETAMNSRGIIPEEDIGRGDNQISGQKFGEAVRSDRIEAFRRRSP